MLEARFPVFLSELMDTALATAVWQLLWNGFATGVCLHTSGVFALLGSTSPPQPSLQAVPVCGQDRSGKSLSQSRE